MPKVTVVQVIYNSRRFIEPVFSAIFAQTFKDFNVVAVISGNEDGGKELLMQKFPQVEIIDLGYNIGFAKGHNLVFEKYTTLSRPSDGHPLPEGEGNNEKATEFFQLVNPDMIMEPNYVEEMLKAFADPKVGAATGKLYQAPADIIAGSQEHLTSYILNHKSLDTTGVTISKSGRGRDRGQHELDNHQYDKLTLVDGVSGAGCMFRASALQATKVARLKVRGSSLAPSTSNLEPMFEFFDEDFGSYWEDVDLSWRMKNAGWKNVFVPTAIGYHGRGAGSSEGGYADVAGFIRHHKKLSQHVKQLNYKNHIFMYIKNSPWFYPQFFVREFFMLCYVLVFETATLKVLPEMFKLMPKIWKKRHLIFQ